MKQSLINSSDMHADEIRRLVRLVDTARMETNDEVREFIAALTTLIYDYKMLGKIYDFYSENLEYHKQNKVVFLHIEEVVRHIAGFLAAFPNLSARIENIIVYKAEDSFYKIARRLTYTGNNYGYSKYGPPTGRSLENNCLNQSLMHLKKNGNSWKITFEINNDSEVWLEEVMGAVRDRPRLHGPDAVPHTGPECMAESVLPDPGKK